MSESGGLSYPENLPYKVELYHLQKITNLFVECFIYFIFDEKHLKRHQNLQFDIKMS